MSKIIVRLYLLLGTFKSFICNLMGMISFLSFTVFSNVFFKKDTRCSLVILKKFVKATCTNYPSSIVTGRDTGTSLSLLYALVDKYLETKSSVILDQLLHVYKEEILERENNGRK